MEVEEKYLLNLINKDLKYFKLAPISKIRVSPSSGEFDFYQLSFKDGIAIEKKLDKCNIVVAFIHIKDGELRLDDVDFRMIDEIKTFEEFKEFKGAVKHAKYFLNNISE